MRLIELFQRKPVFLRNGVRLRSANLPLSAALALLLGVLAAWATSQSAPQAGQAAGQMLSCSSAATRPLYLPALFSSPQSGSPTPTFYLQVSSGCLEVESGTGGEYTRELLVSVGGLGGFSDSAALSLEGVPSGVSADFSPSQAAPGEKSLLSLHIPLSTAQGAYHLLIHAQAGNIQRESDLWLIVRPASPPPQEGEQEEIRPDQMPVLQAAALTPSTAFPLPGETVQLRVEVRNNGQVPAEGVPVLVFAGQELLAIRYLDIPEGRSVSFQAPWTPVSAGKVVASAQVDPGQELPEMDRSDNQVSTDLVVAPRPGQQADLEATGIDFIAKSSGPSLLRATVRNNGTSTAQAPVVLQVDGQTAALLLSDPIAAGGSQTLEIPWPSDPSPQQFSVEINPRFGAEEIAPGNNRIFVDRQPDDDLRISDFSVDSTRPESNQSLLISISFRVLNAGKNPVNQTFRTRIYPGTVSNDVDNPHVDPYFVVTPGLAVGESVYIERSFVAPADSFNIEVQTDYDQVVAEDFESNNEHSERFNDPLNVVGRWRSLGPRKLTEGQGASGRLFAILIQPDDPDTIYVASPSQNPSGGTGIWKTTNGGSYWYPVADSLPSLSISALAMDPSDYTRLYALAKGVGIFASADSGNSWLQSAADSRLDGNNLLVNPNDPWRLLATTTSGVYLSTDAGETWNATLMGGNAIDLQIDQGNPDHILATLTNKDNISVIGIYESWTAGDSWRKLSGCPGGRLPQVDTYAAITLAQSGNTWYAAYLTKSEDQGDYFTIYKDGPGLACSIGGAPEDFWEQTWRVGGDRGSDASKLALTFWNGIYADPLDPSFVYATGTSFWVSTNGGTFFTPSSGPHADQHGFAVDPSDSKIIYTANDGGLYRSANRGATGSWEFYGEGIRNVEFYDIAHPTSNPDLIMGGTQDNGTDLYLGSSTIWSYIRDGDGATVDFDPQSTDILYSMGQYADSIQRKVSNSSWKALSKNLPEKECFNLYYQVHPGNGNIMLAACLGSLWKTPTTDPPGDWSVLFTPANGNGSVTRSQVDRTVDLYYATTSRGVLYAGRHGTNWQAVFSHPSSWGITDIEVDPYRASRVYASFGGKDGAERVYMLMRSSAAPTSMSATDITGDLPSGLSIRTLAVDRFNDFTLFAGLVAGGVYRGRSFDGGATWTWDRFNDGMPPAVDINQLIVHPISGVLRAGTMGRSAYEVNPAPPLGSVLTAQGHLTLLRLHDVGSGYGPPTDSMNVEVVIQLDSLPGRAYGFQLRADPNEAARRGMLDVLRDAFRRDTTIRIDYVRTGIRSGVIFRVMALP